MSVRKSVSIAVLASVAMFTGASRQVSAQGNAAAAVKAGFVEVNDWIAKSAELVPADKYTYKPVGTVRSVGEMVAHVADGYAWFCNSAAAKTDVPWADTVEKGKTDKATVIAALKKAAATCTAAYNAPTARIDKLMGNVAHANLHYGNLITYLRMLGLKPPSS
jgi:uncharacterized damage-inducible protein DinB